MTGARQAFGLNAGQRRATARIRAAPAALRCMHRRTPRRPREPAMRAMLFVALATAALPVFALDCGALVDRDVVLTRDLDCAGPALVVTRHGVRIDLAGHAIRTTPEASAIAIEDVHGIVVLGPGRIEGAMTGIEATRARDLSVHGIDFVDVGEGVRLTNASLAEVSGNRFERIAGHAVVALSLPGALARGGGHRIAGNAIENAEFGVLVDAPFGRPSSIDGNRFEAIGTFGVMAPSAFDAVHGNRFGAVGVAAVVD
jgi:hypothetical protein